ncbi:unnamed protein product [Nyctereutes procyonoides]|uniref:(raccoon dog) hypothetical protein n=1 Tax=Nyctereutes procyonoides TaxID=34880 RepID=A0A811YLD4_NYCPR|nr:unnamed protein product [Nyctereutes procyonoides]
MRISGAAWVPFLQATKYMLAFAVGWRSKRSNDVVQACRGLGPGQPGPFACDVTGYDEPDSLHLEMNISLWKGSPSSSRHTEAQQEVHRTRKRMQKDLGRIHKRMQKDLGRALIELLQVPVATVDTQKINRRESKHTTENHQFMKKGRKRKGTKELQPKNNKITYNIPRLNHEKIENLNRPITSKDIEAVIQNLPTKRTAGPDAFPGKFYKTLKELVPVILKLFQKIEEEEISQTHKASIQHYTDTKAR